MSADKSKCGKFLDQMNAELKFPKDVDQMLETSMFLTNRFAPYRGKENVLQPVSGEHEKIHW